MLARSFRSLSGAALTTLGIAACAATAIPHSNGGDATRAPVPSLIATSRLFDAERIRRSGAQTAWDAVRLLVPRYRLQPSGSSSPRVFGTPDARHLESPIQLFIDGHPIRDLDALEVIPAREVVAIYLLNASEAATHFGPGNGGGAIVVQTLTWRGAR